MISTSKLGCSESPAGLALAGSGSCFSPALSAVRACLDLYIPVAPLGVFPSSPLPVPPCTSGCRNGFCVIQHTGVYVLVLVQVQVRGRSPVPSLFYPRWSGVTGMHRSKQARTALRAGGKQLSHPANARPAGLFEHPSSEVLIRPARPRKNK